VLLLLGDEWLTSGGLLKTVLRFPLSTAFPVFQLLALGALVGLAVSQLRQEPLHLPPSLRLFSAKSPGV
jgi:hypothetical protein